MESEDELKKTGRFIAEYAARLLGAGVHTSRVVRNSKRIGRSQGVAVRMTTLQKTLVMTLCSPSGESVYTEVIDIPALPIGFELNSDLSALSWEACDEGLSLEELRRRYERIISKPRIDPMFVLVVVGLANASFCKLFNGDWVAVGIVFTSTLAGFSARQQLTKAGVNHFIIFILSAFVASLCASSALRFDCTAETAIATSVLFLVPGVPLINGVIDIVEGHVLIGCSRLIGALLLILCIAVGLSVTLLMVKGSLL